MSTVVIRAEGVDITDSCIIKGATFNAASKGAAGQAKVRVRDLRHERLLRIGTELTLDIDGIRKWGGYIMAISRGYFFDETPGGCNDHLVPRYFEIEASDYNILLQKRVLYNKIDPTIMELTRFPVGTTDQEFLTYYLTNHSDLLDEGITLAIDSVGSPIVEEFMSFSASSKIVDLLQYARADTGAIDYITPDKVFRHVDDDTADAAFGISDQPGVGEVGCREWEIDNDGTNLRNDALVWGAGQGADTPVFSRSTDGDSVDEHGVWQVGDFKTAIWHKELTDRIADSYVYGSPQNLRGGKDDAISSKLTVFTPDFTVAEKVPLRSEVLEYEDILPIRSEAITFPTPTNPRYDLILGRDIDDPWSTMEFWWPTWVLPDFRLRPPVFIWPSFDPCNPVPCEEETFSRGDLSNTWGPSEIGQNLTWSISALADLIGGQGFLQTSEADSTPVQGLALSMGLPLEVEWNMRFSALPTSPIISGLIPRGGIAINWTPPTGPSTGPSMWVGISPEGDIGFAFIVTGGSQLIGGAFPVVEGFDPVTAILSCRFRVEASTIFGKVWIKGALEPPDWQDSRVSTNTGGTLLRAFGRNASDYGSPGFFDGVTIPDIYMDNIRVCSSLDLCGDPPDAPCHGQWKSEVLTRIPTPPGRPPDKTYYQTTYQWSPGTMQVWVDGLLISGHSFIGNYYLKYVELDASIDVGSEAVPKSVRGYYFATCIHVFVIQ